MGLPMGTPKKTSIFNLGFRIYNHYNHWPCIFGVPPFYGSLHMKHRKTQTTSNDRPRLPSQAPGHRCRRHHGGRHWCGRRRRSGRLWQLVEGTIAVETCLHLQKW